MLQRPLTFLAVAILAGTLTGCAGTSSTGNKAVGVAMPTTASERWIKDGDSVKLQLETLGYKVDLEYAEDDAAAQAQQIDTMLNDHVELLIIGAVDGGALNPQLERAKADGVHVIAYDRLLSGTDAVDGYASFDNKRVGELQATSLLTHLGAMDATGAPIKGAGPFNIELFAGSPDDNNAHVFFDAAMGILKPYLDAGTLVVPSGQSSFDQVATEAWKPETAGARMSSLLSSAGSTTINGVLAPNDDIAQAILSQFKTAGKQLPAVTGQDASLAAVKSVAAHEQTSTIYKDTRQLAEASVLMGLGLLKGNSPEVNDLNSYNNGVIDVPSLLLAPQLVTADNYTQVLVDSGYYTKEEIQ